MTRGLFGPGTIVLGGGAVLLTVFLLIGFLLPTTWEAQAEATVPAPPAALLPFLDSPEGWQAWTPWPDSTSRSGPERGEGASISWSSRELGSGAFRIESSTPLAVSYTVSVEGAGGAVMETRGSVTLSPEGAGTRVVWRESGDLGRNPLMGYWALSMDRAQSTEMQKSLGRLTEVVGEAAEEGSPRLPDGAADVLDGSVRPDSARTR
jgi:carbon monoxide dehydrogenase subunit G